MPSADNVNFGATAGEYVHDTAFFVGQDVQNNDAPGRDTAGVVAEDTGGATHVTPPGQSQDTPIRPSTLFAGAGGQSAVTPPTPSAGGGAVLAALKGEVLACTPEKLRELCMWQPELGSAKKEDFREEVLLGHPANILVLACLQKDSPVLKLVHGITKYMGRDAPELKKVFLGRVGEWTPENTPHIVELPPQKTWNWVQIEFQHDLEGWQNHVENSPDNKFKLFVPAANNPKTDKEIPLMAYLPPPLALYAHEEERTCLEMYLFCKTLLEDPASGLESKHLEFLMDFFMAGGQTAGGTGSGAHKSALQESFKAVISVKPGFIKWANTHMSGYLGQTPLPPSPTAGTPMSAIQQQGAFMQAAGQVLTDLTKQQSKVFEQQEKKKSDTGALMSEYAVAALQGFCAVTSWREIPILYVLLKTCKDNTEARTLIEEGMSQWSAAKGIEISQNVFLPEDLIKNIRAVKPNPTCIVGTSRVSDVEFTNLACLPLRMHEIEARLLGEQAARDTEVNRTKAEKEKQLKGEMRNPPDSYFGLKLNVATTAALVSVCYGERSELYANLVNIYEILKQKKCLPSVDFLHTVAMPSVHVGDHR